MKQFVFLLMALVSSNAVAMNHGTISNVGYGGDGGGYGGGGDSSAGGMGGYSPSQINQLSGGGQRRRTDAVELRNQQESQFSKQLEKIFSDLDAAARAIEAQMQEEKSRGNTENVGAVPENSNPTQANAPTTLNQHAPIILTAEGLTQEGVDSSIKTFFQVYLNREISFDELEYYRGRFQQNRTLGEIEREISQSQGARGFENRPHANGNNEVPLNAVQANALEVEQNVNQLTAQARETLAQPHVTAQLEIEAARYVNDQLDFSDRLAHLGDVMANENASPSTIELVGAVASDIARSTGEFLVGLNEGAQNAIIGTAQAMRAIYNDPALITHLSTNIMNTITAGPGAVVHAAWNGLNHVGDAVYNFEVAMAYGTPEQRGAALGEFGGNVLLGIAGGEASVAARGAVEGIAGAVTQAGAADALGTAVNQGIRASEALAPEMAEIDVVVARVGDSAGKIGNFDLKVFEAAKKYLPELKQVRNEYSADTIKLKETITEMKAANHSKEGIARHIHNERRQAGIKYKDLTPQELRSFIYERNTTLYNDPLGPSIEFLIDKHTRAGLIGDQVWEEIIKTSTKPNKKLTDFINSLGAGGK